MTDSIDLDELDVESDDEPDANRGDWFWRGESDPDEGWLDADAGRETDAVGEPAAADAPEDAVEHGSTSPDSWTRQDAPDGPGPAATDEDGTGSVDDGDGDTDRDPEEDGADRDHEPVPGVPRQNRDRPVGIPVEGGGAGGVTAADRAGGGAGEQRSETDTGAGDGETTAGGDDASSDGDDGPTAADADGGDTVASGPHGGGADDMTMALTYAAAQRLDDPRFAVIDAKGWTDWLGIVGDVPAHAINKFQRDHEIDVDFFSGAGQEPAERLADVDEHSMFYAERMVLVGVDGERAIAERAGWEFVHLETAAEKADWDLSEST